MRKILIVVENAVCRDALSYFFRCLKHSVQIVSTSRKKFQIRKNESDLIVLDAHKRIDHLPRMIQRIRLRHPDLKVICLVHSGKSRIREIVNRKNVQAFLADNDLIRIHKVVTKLGREKH